MAVRYSILVPVHNGGRLLEPCLQSLLASVRQASVARTGNLEVEIVCLDDGSTDGSSAVLELLSSSICLPTFDFRVARQANGGVAAARNAALALARGEYVLWCDADDFVRPEWLEEIDAAIVRWNEPDVLLFDSVWECGPSWRRRGSYGRRGGPLASRFYLLDLLRGTHVGCYLWQNAIRRSLFSGLRFDSSVDGLEDYMLLPEILRRARTVAYLPKALYAYRLREGSLSNGGNGQRLMWRCGTRLRDPAYWRQTEGSAAAAAATAGACAVAYNRCVSRVLGEHGRDVDNAADAAFVRRRLGVLMFRSGVDFRWKLKFLLCALGAMVVMRRRWQRLKAVRKAAMA